LSTIWCKGAGGELANDDDFEVMMSDEEPNKEAESDGDGDYQGPSDGKPKRRRRGGSEKPSSLAPKKWGPITRDRVIRALLDFGFGRWEKIRQEGLAETRTLDEIDSFSRSYILQCGRYAGTSGKDSRVDSTFVADAIKAASDMEPQIQSGQMTIPETMVEDRFVAKLKTGQARKALQKLELLLQLSNKVKAAIATALDETNQEDRISRGLDNMTDESKVEALGRGAVASKIILGDIRPKWAGQAIAPWWDTECDRHLLLGLWWYGYAKYLPIRDDANLCFRTKIDKYLETNPTLPAPKATHSTSCTLSPDFSWPAQTVTIKMEDGSDRQVTFPAKRFSEYRGVYSQPGSIMWVAQVQRPNKVTWHGPFEEEKEAALAYDKEVRSLLGGGAAETNFTEDGRRRPEVNGSSNSLSLVWHRPSKYRGVRAVGAKWTAQISNKHLGTYTSEVEAALKYNEAAREQSGGSASVYNFPDGLTNELERIDAVTAAAVVKAEAGNSPFVPYRFTPLGANASSTSGDNGEVQDQETERPPAVESTSAESVNDGEEIDMDDDQDQMDVDNEGGDNGTDVDKDDGDGASTTAPGNEKMDQGKINLSPYDAHWPDSKTLNKLSQWLLEDRQATMTMDEKQKEEEAKQQKKVRKN